jgi:hypothetical protein
MIYEITELNNGIATVVYGDGSYANISLTEDMTEDEVVSLIQDYAPKLFSTPSFLSVGMAGEIIYQPPVIKNIEETVAEDLSEDWLAMRKLAYGSVEKQIEFITENGLENWVDFVAAIKTLNPKV